MRDLKYIVATGAVALLLIVSFVWAPSTTQVSASPRVEMTFTTTFKDVVSISFEVLPSGATKVTVDSIRFDVAGDWVGIWEHDATCIVTKNGRFQCQAFAIFTGTIAGKTGTVVFRIQTLGVWHNFPDGPIDARSELTIVRGTGDLSNVHGHGVEDPLDFVRIWVHFDP